MHAIALEHETLVSESNNIPLGLGLGWSTHPAPFQRSTRVTCLPVALSTYQPTAVHARALVHDTPDRALSLATGVGADCIVHAVPSHCSINRSLAPCESPLG